MPVASNCSVSLLPSEVVPPTPTKGLSDKQRAAILRVFKPEIRAGTKPSRATVQNRRCTTAVLSTLATLRKKVKQVVNHVNYIIDSKLRDPPRCQKSQALQKSIAGLAILMILLQDPVASGKSWMRMTPKPLNKLSKNVPNCHPPQQ